MSFKIVDKWETAGAMLSALVLGAAAIATAAGVLSGIAYFMKLITLWALGG